MNTWFSRFGTSVPPSGIAVISSGDSLTVIGSPRVSAWPGGVLYRGLNQHASGALAERPPGEVIRQVQIKVIRPVGVRLPLGGRHFVQRRHPSPKP